MRALSPDVAILHAQQADEFGNIRYLVSPFLDVLIAKASKKVIVSVDEMISNKEVRAECYRTAIPAHFVDMVVHLPYGAHPCSSPTYYIHDEDHLVDYIQRAKKAIAGEDKNAYSEYLRKYVYGPESIYDYIEVSGGLRRMIQLRRFR